MADFNSGNFINPDYATPEQVAQLREYAKLLQTQSVQPTATHWTGALAQALMGMQGARNMGNANQLQRQLLQQGQQGLQQAGQNPYAAQLLGQQNPTSPQANSGVGAGALPRGLRNNNPGNIEDGPFAKSIPGYQGSDGRFAIFDSPEHGQQAMDSLLSSYGNRGFNTPNSVIGRWAPQGENNATAYAATVAKQLGVDPNAPLNMADPAIRQKLGAAITGYENGGRQPTQMAQNGGDLSAFYMNPSIPKELKDNVLKGLTPTPATDVYERPGVRMGVMGGTQGLPTQNFTPGFRAPATVGAEGSIGTTIPQPAPGQGGGAPNLQGQMQPLADAAKGISQQMSGNKAVRGAIESDVQAANLVPQTRQILATMKDDILAHGDKMVFGPTSDWVNNLKRSVAQHAPGLMSESDLSGLASADSFDKLSAQLQSIVGRQVGGTDASLMQGMRSVPGQHNSKEGALALIDMLDQVSQQQAKFMIQNQYKIGTQGFDFLGAKNKFFEENPIKNPLTGNALRMDLGGGSKENSQSKTIGSKTYQKINGVWHEMM